MPLSDFRSVQVEGDRSVFGAPPYANRVAASDGNRISMSRKHQATPRAILDLTGRFKSQEPEPDQRTDPIIRSQRASCQHRAYMQETSNTIYFNLSTLISSS